MKKKHNPYDRMIDDKKRINIEWENLVVSRETNREKIAHMMQKMNTIDTILLMNNLRKHLG